MLLTRLFMRARGHLAVGSVLLALPCGRVLLALPCGRVLTKALLALHYRRFLTKAFLALCYRRLLASAVSPALQLCCRLTLLGKLMLVRSF